MHSVLNEEHKHRQASLQGLIKEMFIYTAVESNTLVLIYYKIINRHCAELRLSTWWGATARFIEYTGTSMLKYSDHYCAVSHLEAVRKCYPVVDSSQGFYRGEGHFYVEYRSLSLIAERCGYEWYRIQQLIYFFEYELLICFPTVWYLYNEQ